MMRNGMAVVLALLWVPTLVSAADAQQPPNGRDLIQRACQAAGGMEAFGSLGLLEVSATTEEVTQKGEIHNRKGSWTILAPGPNPGRLEIPESKVIAGDDGSEGWAVVGGKPDTRPMTKTMIKRMLASELFAPLLPFSLNWDGVSVLGVLPAEVDGRPVWRLRVEFARTFFHTPQISTSWTVDLDRSTYQVIRAEAPATDLGGELKADGMRFTWADPIKVGGVTLRATQRTTGLNQSNQEVAHNRLTHFSFKTRPAAGGNALFANPNPAPARPLAQRPPGQP